MTLELQWSANCCRANSSEHRGKDEVRQRKL